MASGAPQNGRMSGIVKMNDGDEQQLLEAVATVGPVAAAVDATSNAFRVHSIYYSKLIIIVMQRLA